MSGAVWGRVRGSSRSGLAKGLLLSTAMVAVAGGAQQAFAQAQPASGGEGTAPAWSPAATFAVAQARSPGGAATVTATKEPRSVDTPTANTGSTGLAEVVVTARKRAENLQRTPVSETAISGAEAEQLNVRDFQNLRGLVPDLEVTPQANGGAALTIRGVGQTNDQVNADAKTGYYVNEVYVARQEGNSLYFYDVNSLQVLKGPQGTLFGKNTTGGAILLTNAQPGPDYGGYVQVRAGDYSRLDTEGAINVPLTDTLLTRFSFRTDSADGFIKHVLDDGESDNVDDKSFRGQIRWKPTSKLVVDLLGEYNQSNTNGMVSVVTGCNPNAYSPTNYQAVEGKSYCATYPTLPESAGHYLVYGGATLSVPTSSLVTPLYTGGDYNDGLTRHGHPGPFNNTEVTTLNLRVNYQLNDDISLKSITGYRRSHSAFYNPTEDAPNDLYAEYDSTPTNELTEEDNVTGKAFGGRLNYVAGVYFYSQKTAFLQDTGPDWDGDPIGYAYGAHNNFTSYAGYAQASYKVLPALEATVGVRYTYDHKSANSDIFDQTSYSGVCNDTDAQAANDPYDFLAAFLAGAAACGGHLVGADRKQWSDFNPRGQLSYQLTPDIYLYTSITTGYNAGGFNQQLGADLGGGLIGYNPEKLTDYEGGFKSEFFNHRLRFNVTGFYQKYSDIQTTVEVTYNHVPTRAIQTGASEHEDGVEAELELTPTRDLLVRGNMSYLNQAYDSVAPGITLFNINSPVSTAPKYTYAFDAAYTYHLSSLIASEATVTPALNWRAVGAKAGCNPIGACYLPAYGLLGGRADFKLSPQSPWTASFFGTNLLNAKVVLDEMLSSQLEFGLTSYTPGRPREYGVEFTRTF